MSMTIRNVASAVVGCLLMVAPSYASPITGPLFHGECRTLAAWQALGVLVWTAETDMQGASFHDPEPGCEPTTRHAANLLFIEDVGAGTLIRFDPYAISSSACGRYQVDLRSGDDTIEFMINLLCEASAPPILPDIPPPGPIPPDDLPPFIPPDSPPGDSVPLPHPIPEPQTILVVGVGMVLLWRRRHKIKCRNGHTQERTA